MQKFATLNFKPNPWRYINVYLILPTYKYEFITEMPVVCTSGAVRIARQKEREGYVCARVVPRLSGDRTIEKMYYYVWNCLNKTSLSGVVLTFVCWIGRWIYKSVP
jgi:hypothetical protein